MGTEGSALHPSSHFYLPATSFFLKLGSAEGCQGFRETKMRNGGRLLLAVQNLYVRV
jgi:hypothetical protein